MPKDTRQHDVFISFASEDRSIADTVSERLRRDGIRVWRFTDGPGSGSWHLNQLRALRDHHHLSRSSLTKNTGLLLALNQHILPGIDAATEVITIGDSVNDAPLFEPGTFAVTVGVRSVLQFLPGLADCVPNCVTLASGGAGFNEIGSLLVQAR